MLEAERAARGRKGCRSRLVPSNSSKQIISRRNFLRLAAGAGLTALAVDSVLLEPNRPQVVRKDLALARWPEALAGFTIAVLSDFHYDAYFSDHPLHAAVPMVNALAADMIVLTGDFVSVPGLGGDYVRAASAAEPCARHLQQMHARYGVCRSRQS